MNEFILALLAVTAIGAPIALLLRTQRRKGQSCGGDCASCGSQTCRRRDQADS